jgi:hypothetical protein
MITLQKENPMASQVIQLDPTAFAALLALPSGRRNIAFANQDLRFIASRDGQGQAQIRIHVDPVIVEIANDVPFLHDLFALLITATGATISSLPRILPEDVVEMLLGRLHLALGALAEHAHDMLEFCGPIEAARSAQPHVQVPPVRLQPLGTKLREELDELTLELAADLQELDDRLARYRPTIAASGFGETVVRLGLQHELAAFTSINLAPSRTTLIWVNVAGSPANAPVLLRANHNRLHTAQALAQRVHDAAAASKPWLTLDTVLELQRIRLSELPGCELIGKWREREDDSFEAPVERATEWLARLAKTYDINAWCDYHPVLRAGFAYLDWVRSSPLAMGTRRLGDQILAALLRESGLPMLPLDAIIARTEATWSFDLMVGRAGERQVFLRTLIAALVHAIDLAETWLPDLSSAREVLMLSFLERSQKSAKRAAIDSSYALSLVLGIDAGLARSSHGAELKALAMDHIPELQRVDCGRPIMVFGVALPIAHSHPLARRLAAMPTLI